MTNTIFILIHGFGGNISEIAPLATFLNEKGYPAICPSLKGHTGLKQDLKKTTYQDWISSVAEELVKVKPNYQNLILVGFSMGGLIAINLALQHQVTAVITINTPIFYWDFKRIGINLIADVQTGNFKHIQRYIHSSVSLPLKALVNFRAILNKTKPLIKQVTCPILVLQGTDDDTVQPVSANYIYNNVRSNVKQIAFLDNSGHVMLQSPAAGQAMNRVSQFVNDLIQQTVL
ncbi:MAG TPA: alpha/beta fold hydrolase [Bacillota bacterium]|nr:alpha/beta fold hydrolase [Bacillota bacterium]